MAARPGFFPLPGAVGVNDSTAFEFTWYPGLSFAQKQRNVSALHASIKRTFPTSRILEVSSKSTEPLGVSLSAFNLCFSTSSCEMSVETAFQASKVFEKAGPFPELYGKDPRSVRNYVRHLEAGRLVGFEFDGEFWDLRPTRAFYDWIYIRALSKNPRLSVAVCEYNCFTDIEFNPLKSLNCQAYAVALYLSFHTANVLDKALESKSAFLKYHPQDIVAVGNGANPHVESALEQLTLNIRE